MNNSHLVKPEKNDCCGCGLCAEICPVKAIEMKEDELGYIYPVINESACVHCNKCTNSCIFNGEHVFSSPISTFAGVRKDENKLKHSSSGGVFAAVADRILEMNGYVCGAMIENDFSIAHKIVSQKADLLPLLGSKYVQSDITAMYKTIKELLADGKKVLFCGTPCQVHAIKKYTDNPTNFITIEVICHGVPNQEMFKGYVKSLSSKKVKTFFFRDKGQGWSFNHKVIFEDGTVKRINHRLSSYMTLFMKGSLYRESCFSCPYAQANRNADITIGDFWGVVRKCPELAKKIDIDKGVSCVIVNSEKGKQIMNESSISLYPVAYSDIIDGNGPLNHPSRRAKNADEVQRIWQENHSWKEVNAFWKHSYYKLRFKLWAMLPNSIRNMIRILMKVR